TPKSWHSTPEHLKVVPLRTSTLAGLRGTSFSGQVGSAARSESIGHMLPTKSKTAKVEYRLPITNPSGGRTLVMLLTGPVISRPAGQRSKSPARLPRRRSASWGIFGPPRAAVNAKRPGQDRFPAEQVRPDHRPQLQLVPGLPFGGGQVLPGGGGAMNSRKPTCPSGPVRRRVRPPLGATAGTRIA